MAYKRGFHTFLAVCLILVLISSTVLVGGCAKGTNAPTIIQGWVSAGDPVSGAKLTIYNIKGKQIYQSTKPATGDFGSFLIAVKNLPSDFRIVASGGDLGGEVLSSELSADYRGFDAKTGIIYINAVTTMGSAYLAKHSDKTLDEATADVKSFLEIPEWVDIGGGLRTSEKYFSHGRFIAAATNSGSVSQYIAQMVTEMEGSNKGVTRPFAVGESHVLLGASNGLLGGMGPGVGGYIVDKLAGGVISWAGGKALGWGLSKIGLDFPDETTENMKKMQAQLEEISKQLTDLQNKLDEVYSQLSAEIKQTGYDIRIGQMNDLISSINFIREQLMIFVSNPPSDSKLLEAKRGEISDLIKLSLLAKVDVINNQLTGLNGQTPLLKLWVEIVKSKHRFLSADDNNAIQSQFEYFDTLQQWMIELLVEYYHATGETETYHPGIDSVIQSYNNNLEKQKALLVQKIPDGVFVDTTTGKMWMRKPIFNSSGAQYKTESGPMLYVYGSLNDTDHPVGPNPNSTLNQNYLVNHDFTDWIMPTLGDMDELIKSYSGSRATEEFFVKNGAFPAGSTLQSIWGDSGGNVWTGEYYWAKWLGREVVNLKCIGVSGKETPVAILNEGSAQIGSLFPYRVPTQNERYYW